MPFIDKKGRLFGKINIVDFFIIVLVMFIIPGFLYTYKVLAKRPTWVPTKWVKVEAVAFTMPEIVDIIKPGGTYYAFGEPRAKIVRILEREDKYKEKLKSAMHKSSMPEYEQRIPVFLELDLLCAHSDENEPYYFERNPVLVNMDDTIYTFNTDTYSIKFYILEIKD